MVQFFEAFPDLSTEDKLYDYFAGAMVEKVSASRTKMLAFIYCQCDQFLPLRIIRNMEQKLYKQVFRRLGVRPKLEIRYPFAASYELEKLVGKCEEMLKEELREYNAIDYMKFCREPFEVEEDAIIITCDDDFLCHDKSSEIRDFFRARIKRRFDMEVEIRFRYIEKKRKKQGEPEVYHMVVKKENPEEETAASGEKNIPKKPFVPKKSNYRKPANDPSVFFGRNVEGEVIPIKEIVDEIGEVVIDGMIRSVEEREIKGEKLIVTFAITDFTDTIICKVFIKKELVEELSFFEFVKKGNYIRVKGMASFDTYDKEIRISNIVGMKEIKNFRVGRMDNAPVKRVELHAHTQMSDMDAVVDCQKMVARAQEWGHPAIAITDHGVVQSFADADHAIAKDDFKVIYGCEAYLVDDLDDTVQGSKGQSLQDSFVVFDLETTGFSPTRNRIIEIGAVKV